MHSATLCHAESAKAHCHIPLHSSACVGPSPAMSWVLCASDLSVKCLWGTGRSLEHAWEDLAGLCFIDLARLGIESLHLCIGSDPVWFVFLLVSKHCHDAHCVLKSFHVVAAGSMQGSATSIVACEFPLHPFPGQEPCHMGSSLFCPGDLWVSNATMHAGCQRACCRPTAGTLHYEIWEYC